MTITSRRRRPKPSTVIVKLGDRGITVVGVKIFHRGKLRSVSIAVRLNRVATCEGRIGSVRSKLANSRRNIAILSRVVYQRSAIYRFGRVIAFVQLRTALNGNSRADYCHSVRQR